MMKEELLMPHFPNALALACNINKAIHYVVEREGLGMHRLVFSQTPLLRLGN